MMMTVVKNTRGFTLEYQDVVLEDISTPFLLFINPDQIGPTYITQKENLNKKMYFDHISKPKQYDKLLFLFAWLYSCVLLVTCHRKDLIFCFLQNLEIQLYNKETEK